VLAKATEATSNSTRNPTSPRNAALLTMQGH
jgi:hypothetical protein